MRARITLFAATMLVSPLISASGALALEPLDTTVGTVKDATGTQTTLDAGTLAGAQSQVDAIGKTILGNSTPAPPPTSTLPSVKPPAPSTDQPSHALPSLNGGGSTPGAATPAAAGSGGTATRTRPIRGVRAHRRTGAGGSGKRSSHESGRGGRARASAARGAAKRHVEPEPRAGGSFGTHNATAYRITDECCDATPRPPGEPSIGLNPAWGVGGGSAVGFGIGTLVVVLLAGVLLVGVRTNTNTERT